MALPASSRASRVVPPTPANIRRAAGLCRDGALVVVPTETVYGLAARADTPAAVATLVAAKGRPPDKPFSRMVRDWRVLPAIGVPLPPWVAELADAFWPGPLTLVLPLPDGSSAGFRVPDHPVALAWLRELAPVVPAVTSANPSGEPPALDAASADASLPASVALVLDDGPSPGGLASTVVRVHPSTAPALSILRHGPLAAPLLAFAAARRIALVP